MQISLFPDIFRQSGRWMFQLKVRINILCQKVFFANVAYHQVSQAVHGDRSFGPAADALLEPCSLVVFVVLVSCLLLIKTIVLFYVRL